MDNTSTWARRVARHLTAGVLVMVSAAALTGCGSGGSGASDAGLSLEAKVEKAVNSDITVQEAGDTVTLSGTVQRQDQVAIAQSVAQTGAPGKKIVNNLTAGGPARPGGAPSNAPGGRPAPGQRPNM